VPVTKDLLIESSLNLAWSHWTALGVRGTAPAPSTAIDPEALLYLTACLVECDARLRDEAADWWIRYEHHISRARLRGLRRRFSEQIASKLDALLELLHTKTRTSGKSRLEHLNTPARSLLRMRCVFGASARAEVLLELLTRRELMENGLTALALSEVGYSKRNIAFILDDLVMGGILIATSEGNRTRYRLADPDGLERVLRPLPSVSGGWHFRLPILATFVELAKRLRDRDAVVQGIEARKTFDTMTSNIVRARITTSIPTAIAETYWPELQRWLIDNVIADEGDSGHRIARMIEGVWVGPKQEPQRPDRCTSAVLPRISAHPMNDAELLCLDLVQVPTVQPADDWVWAVLSTAATTTYTHTIGLNQQEPWRFVTWALGQQRTYLVECDEPLPHDRIARLYGKTAAARARADRPAIQLRLRATSEE